jgi:class 3 adenylate cyclase
MNGFDVCRKLRESNYINPIILLTSKTELIDKVLGLEIGADDYITKPFNNRELLAHLRAQLRKSYRIIGTSILEENFSDEYKRKLLSVMFTDIAGYSRIMNLDEQLALKLLQDHNRLMKECIKTFKGHVVEIIGDAFLVSFTSAFAAINCAVSIRKLFFEYNDEKPENEKIKIRIGIHLGDVIEFEGRLKGDVINIAARIQQNTEPGEISVSRNVYEVVKGKTSYNISSLGKFSVKNIQEELELYSVNP